MPASLPRRPPRWKEYGIPALLLALTVATVHTTGQFMDAPWELVLGVLSIVLAHEMGHYLACLYYKVDATLPHLLPGPPFISLVGSFGAFIRIRSRMPNRRALFDIGAAGPLAGFVMLLPFLYLGVARAEVVPERVGSESFGLGLPLIYEWAAIWIHGPALDGKIMVIGAYGMAAWFGLLLTALNLMPAGQLDGGHVVYSLLGPRMARAISRVVLVISAALIVVSPSWVLWTALLWFLIGRDHPPTIDDSAPVGPVRAVVGVICLAIFFVSFTPSPFVNSWRQVAQLFG